MFKHLVQLTKQTYEDEGQTEVLLTALRMVDYNKLIERIWTAMENPSRDTKCVLFEYHWTRLADVRNRGLPNIITTLRNGMLFHDACIRSNVFAKLEAMFDNPKVRVYRRRKYVEGEEDRHTIQVVVWFAPYAFLPPPSPIQIRNESAPTMSTLDWSPNN